MQLAQVNLAGAQRTGFAAAPRRKASAPVQRTASADAPRFGGIKNALKRGKKLYDISGPKGKGTFWAATGAGLLAAALFVPFWPLHIIGLGGLAIGGCAFQAYRHFKKASGGGED